MSEYTDEQLDRIDVLVRQHIFGWGQDDALAVWDEGFHPTRDGGQAMEVFERLPGYWCLSHEVDDTWLVSNDQECKSIPTEELVIESAITFRLAICLAALKKKGVEV